MRPLKFLSAVEGLRLPCGIMGDGGRFSLQNSSEEFFPGATGWVLCLKEAGLGSNARNHVCSSLFYPLLSGRGSSFQALRNMPGVSPSCVSLTSFVLRVFRTSQGFHQAWANSILWCFSSCWRNSSTPLPNKKWSSCDSKRGHFREPLLLVLVQDHLKKQCNWSVPVKEGSVASSWCEHRAGMRCMHGWAVLIYFFNYCLRSTLQQNKPRYD